MKTVNQKVSVPNVLLEDILRPLKAKREISQGRVRVVSYKRVNTNLLTPQWIIKTFKKRNAKEIPQIIPEGELLFIQYPKTPLIVLSLENGRLFYFPSKNLKRKDAQKQASIFLELIRERVEGFRIRDFDKGVKLWVENQ